MGTKSGNKGGGKAAPVTEGAAKPAPKGKGGGGGNKGGGKAK